MNLDIHLFIEGDDAETLKLSEVAGGTFQVVSTVGAAPSKVKAVLLVDCADAAFVDPERGDTDFERPP